VNSNRLSKKFQKRFLLVLTVLFCSFSSTARATDWEGLGPKSGITLGPSAGWVDGGPVESGFATGLDLTYFHEVKTPVFFWISGGARLWKDSGTSLVIPYAEAGVGLLLVNVGAGWNMGLNGDGDPWHAVNLFVGFNAPLWTPAKGHLLYIEPYYRPQWIVSGGRGASHEVGALLKWCFGFY